MQDFARNTAMGWKSLPGMIDAGTAIAAPYPMAAIDWLRLGEGMSIDSSFFWNVLLVSCETYRKSTRTTRQVVGRGEYAPRRVASARRQPP